MQKAEIVLSILSQKSQHDKNYVFERIYRNLFNEDFFLNAYRKIYPKQGNMTAGVDGKTIDGFNKRMIAVLIERVKSESYYPHPVRRTYIPKKNGKKRPLGIPSFEDKLVQEVVRQILEAIYEPIFSNNSHGFRPKRSCHTALYQIKTTAKGANWVVEGDITGRFDNIDHDILMMILSKKIHDGRFLELIRRFLKSGYFEFHKVWGTLSGSPQGGLISPVLANIYLHEFDQFMDAMIAENTMGKEKRLNPSYKKLVNKRYMANKRGDTTLADKLLKEMQIMHSRDPMDENYRRVNYVRYADDFVIFINGGKETAISIKEKIAEFFKVNLKLELNADKTLITNLGNIRVGFLGYEIAKSQENTAVKVNSKGVKERTVNGTIQLLVPGKVISEKIIPYSKYGKSHPFLQRVNMPVLDMINEFNAEIRGLYNYYCLATDVSTKLNKFKHIHYFSLAKTIARKENSSVRKVIRKYGIDVPRKQGTGTRKVIGVRYQTKRGEQVMTYFNDSLKKLDEPPKNYADKFGFGIAFGSQLITRLNADTCELCGATDKSIEVHHVRKLKDIIRKYKKRGNAIPNWVLQMSRMNRKTLVVCVDCHRRIHAGK
jgi:group II intron reverse transcriptase/maturase